MLYMDCVTASVLPMLLQNSEAQEKKEVWSCSSQQQATLA